MVADARPSLKIHSSAEGYSSKNIRRVLPTSSSRENDRLGVRRSKWELLPKKTIPSASVMLKSKNLEEEMPLMRKTKSQGLENHVSSTPSNRSERDKDPISRFYIWGNAETINSRHSRERKEENGKKVEAGPEKVDPKRKRMTARGYMAQFKRQRVTKNEPGPSSCNNQSKNGQGGVSMFGGCSFSSKAVAEEETVLLDEQKTIQFLQSEIGKLCRIIKLSEDATLATRRFLEYVSQNRRVHSDSPAIMHAFQLSLCWAGASISKQKVDKRESLVSAKQLLNYKCTEKQALSVYSKIRSLKQMYLQRSEGSSNSGRNCLSAEDFTDVSLGTEQVRVLVPSSKEKSVDIKVGENSAEGKQGEGHVISLPKHSQNVKAASRSREIDENRNGKKKENARRLDKLKQKQPTEVEEFLPVWEEKRRQMDEDHKLELAFICSIYRQGSARLEKLKALEDNFSKKIEEHNLLKAQQLAAAQIEEQMGSESEKDADGSQSSAHVRMIGAETVVSSSSSQHLEIVKNVESTKESQKAIGEEIAASACDLVNQSEASDKVRDKISVPSAEPLIQSAQTSVLPDCTDLPPQQVPQNVLLQDSAPAELQGQNESTLESHSTSPAPCSMPGNVETINSVPSDLILPPADESAVPPLASNDETSHAAENSDQPYTVDSSNHRSNHGNAHVDVSGHHSPTTVPEPTENVAQENCSPVLESGSTNPRGLIEIIPQEPLFQHWESLGQQGSCPVLESREISLRGRSSESSASPQIIASLALAVASACGPPSHNNVAFGVQAGFHRGPNSHFFPPPRSSGHTSTFDPLQYALEMMQKASELMKKRRDEKVVELQSERAKEIQEISKTYGQKFQDVEAEFLTKKMEYLINMEKVRTNMILARTQRNLSLNPHGFCQTQRVSNYQPRRERELAMQGPMRPNHRTPSHLPGPSQLNPHPTPIPAARPDHHQQSRPQRPIRSSPHLSQNLVPPPPPPNGQSSLLRYLASRPAVVSSVTHPCNVYPRLNGSNVRPSQTVQARLPPRPRTPASIPERADEFRQC